MAERPQDHGFDSLVILLYGMTNQWACGFDTAAKPEPAEAPMDQTVDAKASAPPEQGWDE